MQQPAWWRPWSASRTVVRAKGLLILLGACLAWFSAASCSNLVHKSCVLFALPRTNLLGFQAPLLGPPRCRAQLSSLRVRCNRFLPRTQACLSAVQQEKSLMQAEAEKLLHSLRKGNCDMSSLPTLDLRLLPSSEENPLDGVRCPAIILGAFERCGLTAESRRWADWEEFVHVTGSEEQLIQYDANEDSPIFTYWENKSALAQTVRERGVASQGYSKRQSSSLEFMMGCGKGSQTAGWVRYGSHLRGFSPSLSKELGVDDGSAGRLSPLVTQRASDSGNVLLHLWASSPGVHSTAHYDPGWDNAHFVVAGAKQVAVAPLSLQAMRNLQIRPSTHPHDRQARISLFSKNQTGTDSVVDGVLEAQLLPGSGIFIPAGWLHELRALDTPTAAIGVVGIGPEVKRYGDLLMPQQKLLAPFFEVPYFREEVTTDRFAAVLLAFLPQFLQALELDPRAVRQTLLDRYGEATRHEAGLLEAGRAQWQDLRHRHFAPEDRAAISAAAAHYAAEFGTFRRELLPHYVLMFFDTLLSNVGGQGDVAEILGRMLGFVEACDWILESSLQQDHEAPEMA